MRVRTKYLTYGAIALFTLAAGATVLSSLGGERDPLAPFAGSERVGEVTTNWNATRPNDKIVVDVFADPRVPGVSCVVSRATVGSFFPWARDSSDASLSCRQTGPITANLADLKRYDNEDAFAAKQSFLFKTLHVRRMVHLPTKQIIYLVFSDELLNGSPKNNTSSVAVMPWPEPRS